jgi:uncharacterized membrane protein
VNRTLGLFKTTVIGGLVFLIPLVLVAVLLGKAFQLMMLVARPLDEWIPVDSVGGIALANLLAALTIVFCCFLAGLAARSALGRAAFQSLDSKLLLILPGYAFIRGMTAGMGEQEERGTLTPVLARFDDSSQVGFEVERLEGGLVAVYLPGAPDPWSGSLVYMTEDRIRALDVDLTTAAKAIRRLGHGSGQIIPPRAPGHPETG